MVSKYSLLLAICIITMVSCRTPKLEKPACFVKFDDTAYEEYRAKFKSCWQFRNGNDTTDEVGQLDWDCITKCELQNDGIFDKDGKFVSTGIVDFYKKFSNATSKYLDEITQVYDGCKKSSDKLISELKKNGTAVSECKFHGLFDNCISLGRWTIQVC